MCLTWHRECFPLGGEPLFNFIKLRSLASDLYLPLWIEFSDSDRHLLRQELDECSVLSVDAKGRDRLSKRRHRSKGREGRDRLIPVTSFHKNVIRGERNASIGGELVQIDREHMTPNFNPPLQERRCQPMIRPVSSE